MDVSFLRLQTAYSLLDLVFQSIQEGGISGSLADAIENFFGYEIEDEVVVEDYEEMEDTNWGIPDQSSLYDVGVTAEGACDIWE